MLIRQTGALGACEQYITAKLHGKDYNGNRDFGTC